MGNFIGRLAVSLGLLTFAAAPASAFTMNFNENGICSFSTGDACLGSLGPDPSGKVPSPGEVLIFNLPSLTFSGNVGVLDPSGALSDVLRWVNPSGDFTACPPGTPACATQLIFYSLDNSGAKADVGPLSFPNLSNFINENPDGTFTFVSSTGENIYNGVSDVPLPAALPLFATGLGALGLLGWRRRRKSPD